MERRCSLYIEMMIEFQICDTKTYNAEWSVAKTPSYPKNANLGFILDFQIRGCEELGGSSSATGYKSRAEVLVVTRANLHAHHGINGFPEGEGQELIRFGELATKYEELEKNGRHPLFRRHGRIGRCESLAGKVFPRLSGNMVSEYPTGWHDDEDEGCNYEDEGLDNSEDEGYCLVPGMTFQRCKRLGRL